MSFHIEVLKVLAAHPGGRASVAAIKQDLAALASREWSQRVRALARAAPRVDVFSAGYIIRQPDAWQITAAGFDYLSQLEAGTLPEMLMPQFEPDLAEDFSQPFPAETAAPPVAAEAADAIPPAERAPLVVISVDDLPVEILPIESLPDRPQRPLEQYRPAAKQGRTMLRRIRSAASQLLGRGTPK